MSSGKKYKVLALEIEELGSALEEFLRMHFNLTILSSDRLLTALRTTKVDAVIVAGSSASHLGRLIKDTDLFLPLMIASPWADLPPLPQTVYLPDASSPSEFLQLRKLIRSKPQQYQDESYLRIGVIQLNLQRQGLVVERQEVSLTPMEFRVLREFMLKPNVLLRNEDIERAIWGEPLDGSRVLYVNVSSLRRKIGPHARAIRTIRNCGYFYRC